MNDWDRDTTGDSQTEATPRPLVGRPRLPKPGIMAVMAVVMVVVLAAVTFGYFGLHRSSPNRPASVAQAPTATTMTGLTSSPTTTATPTRKPTPTTGRNPSLVATAPPTAIPTLQPTLLPTVAPSPTATPSPAILAVTPNTIYQGNCVLNPGKYFTCTFTLSNLSSTSPLNWTASAQLSGGDETKYLQPTSGTLPPSGTTTASYTIAGEIGDCGPSGATVYLQFTGPNNAVTVTIGC